MPLSRQLREKETLCPTPSASLRPHARAPVRIRHRLMPLLLARSSGHPAHSMHSHSRIQRARSRVHVASARVEFTGVDVELRAAAPPPPPRPRGTSSVEAARPVAFVVLDHHFVKHPAGVGFVCRLGQQHELGGPVRVPFQLRVAVIVPRSSMPVLCAPRRPASWRRRVAPWPILACSV